MNPFAIWRFFCTLIIYTALQRCLFGTRSFWNCHLTISQWHIWLYHTYFYRFSSAVDFSGVSVCVKIDGNQMTLNYMFACSFSTFSSSFWILGLNCYPNEKSELFETQCGNHFECNLHDTGIVLWYTLINRSRSAWQHVKKSTANGISLISNILYLYRM